jgi:large subunit ribosomal protein L15
MISLNLLPKILSKSKKRVGRGESSGKGKTAGRGAKGQTKRGKVNLGFEGGQLPLRKRLPQRPGVGNFPLLKAITITTSQLNILPEKSLVDKNSLVEMKLLPKSLKDVKIKIVASGKVEKELKVSLPASKKAKEIIKRAGGTFTYEKPA